MNDGKRGAGIRVLRLLGWVWGGFVLLAGVAYLSDGVWKGLVLLATGAICLPPILSQLRRVGHVPGWIPYIVSIVMFGVVAPDTTEAPNASPTALDEHKRESTRAVSGAESNQRSNGTAKEKAEPPTREVAKKSDPTPTAPEAAYPPPKQTAAKEEAPEPDRPAPPFKEIRGNMESMTDVQWDRYTPTLIGARAVWIGWIDDVKEKFLGGGYYVQIDMDPPDALSVYDVSFDVSEDNALKLRKDHRLQFDGRIVSVNKVLGSCAIKLDDIRAMTLYQ